jgi:hypothetical protein
VSSEAEVPIDTKLARKGCLGAYAAWAVLIALVVGFVLLTGGRTEDAFGFGVVLLVLPGAIVAGILWGERLLNRAAARLGFRIRQVSWKEGVRPEPVFEAERTDSDWSFTLLEGTRDGRDVALYDYVGSSGRARSKRALGSISTLPEVRAPRLVVYGPTRLRTLVEATDAAGNRVSALSALPATGPGSPLPGFEQRFSSFGEPGAEVLLTESVQKALLALPRRCRLLVEGPHLRWELERDNPFSRGLGRRAEDLLRMTAPLRDAVLEAAALLPSA